MYGKTKVTVVPLRSAGHKVLGENESFDLGSGIAVERLKPLLDAADLWVWKHNAGVDEIKEIGEWDICLVHRYPWEPGTGEPDEASLRLLAYVLAHLRVINPHRDSIDDYIQLEETSSRKINAFRCGKAATRPNRFLCDCENLNWGIKRVDLTALQKWLPWIVNFATNWESYYPLWISLYFCEQAYLGGHNFRTAHLFRVMALEALFCSETSFGKKALTKRIPKFLGAGIDLYGPYFVDYFSLPRMELTVDLIKDVYTLRNKIAHSDSLPLDWKTRIVRPGLNEGITYAGQLLEAALSIGRQSWLKIVNDNLQSIFSEKSKMEAFLR